MKQFLKMTLAAACGVLLVSIVSSFIAFTIIAGLLAIGKTQPNLPKSGVLTIDLSSINIAEQTIDSSLPTNISALSTQSIDNKTIGVYDAVRTLEIAAFDPVVKCILLKTDNCDPSSLTGLEELRSALNNFRKTSGKAVVSYIESPTTKSYWIASVADKVYMTSYLGATTMLTGVSSQSFFLGDLIKTLKVNVQLIRHGKFKSAGEMFTRSSSSPENRLQNQRVVDALWEVLSEDIARSRNISVAQLNDAIDNLKLVVPQDFVSCQLVDELFTKEELKNKLAILSSEIDANSIHYIDFALYSSVRLQEQINLATNKIAIIYADGNIIDGNGKQAVSGDRFAQIIAKVRADDSVKGVVLRVNSPGGSVLASEKIKAELDALSSTKPLVASYGDYAASGGYWISANCNKIYTSATTLTGSIGVFSIIPDFSSTAKDLLHVGVETVSSNKHGDIYSLTKSFDKAEMDYLQKGVEIIYDKFTTIVSEGRSLDKSFVDEVAQGRVWVGTDALKINLVDEVGGLCDALKYMAATLGSQDLTDYNIVAYPKPQTDIEKFMEILDKNKSNDNILVKTLNNMKSPQVWACMEQNISIK